MLPEAEIKRCCLCLYEKQADNLNKQAPDPGRNVERFPAAPPPLSRLVLFFNQDGP